MAEQKRTGGSATRAARHIASALLLLVSLPAGLAAAVAAFFFAAYLTSSVPGLAAAAVASVLLVTGGLSLLGVRWLVQNPRPARVWLPGSVTAVALAITVVGGAGLVFEPMDVEYVEMTPSEDTRFWDLPTGSRIAYWLTPAPERTRPSPIIFLHGGPGAPGALSLGEVGKVLAAEGYDVYNYHQVGAGLSSRLADVSKYTVGRHVDDLEAIREVIGAPRMILVGGSWGGTLAAHYMAAHPGRVEKAVFASPGSIWRPGLTGKAGAARDPIPESDGSETAIITEAATPRFGVVYWLLQINPRAAANLAPDEEMSGFMQPLIARIIVGDVTIRDGDGEPTSTLPDGLVPAGYGFYAMMVTSASLTHAPDPRDALRDLEVPVLVLRGEYDRLRPEVHLEYREVFRDAAYVVVDGAAHSVSASPYYSELLRAFLVGDPLPLEPLNDHSSRSDTAR